MNDPAQGSLRGPILAIETSTVVARVAVLEMATGARLAAAEALAERHSSNLLRLCVETTEKAGVAIVRLGGIACGRGPGSFTGLRVGLSVAKGFAMPTGIPLVMVSSLEALAMDMLPESRPGEWLLPCLDAGKGQVYAAVFRPIPEGKENEGKDDQGKSEGEGDREGEADSAADTPTVISRSDEWVVTPELLLGHLPEEGAILTAGPGAMRYRDALVAGLGARGRIVEIAGPSADSVGARARSRLARRQGDDLGAAVPSYGRPPDITPPRRRSL
jgi:tRNA threonylcarbamoyl adenosine modification protein YeaZ